ncbi:MAG: hypothetical protein HOQ36_07710 [Nocardia sp.]|nr:hypothetical protein [Nocardia sp.]
MQKQKLGMPVRIVNAAAAIAAMGFAIVASIDPAAVLPAADPTPGTEMYAWAYAVRAVPLGVVLLVALFGKNERVLLPLLATAGVVQLGDILIGADRHLVGMMIGGALGAAIHLTTAAHLMAARRRPVHRYS